MLNKGSKSQSIKKLYYVIANLKDEFGEYFQNFYPVAFSKKEAIENTIEYIESTSSIMIGIESVDYCNDIDMIEDLISIDSFEGYIQNIKYSYDC